jgi:histidyl-tRNA synthetase
MVFDPALFRGLDYYTGTVFEMYDASPQNPRAMFGGGRYDNLVGLFGKHQLPGVGFGMGDVTLENFLRIHSLVPELERGVDVFVGMPEGELAVEAEKIARKLREAGLRAVTPLEEGSFGQQLKQASKIGARYAVLLGESEWKKGEVVLKNLVKGTQETASVKSLVAAVKKGLQS